MFFEDFKIWESLFQKTITSKMMHALSRSVIFQVNGQTIKNTSQIVHSCFFLNSQYTVHNRTL